MEKIRMIGGRGEIRRGRNYFFPCVTVPIRRESRDRWCAESRGGDEDDGGGGRRDECWYIIAVR